MALWRYLKFPQPPSLNDSAKHYGLMTCYGCKKQQNRNREETLATKITFVDALLNNLGDICLQSGGSL